LAKDVRPKMKDEYRFKTYWQIQEERQRRIYILRELNGEYKFSSAFLPSIVF